MQGEKKIKYSFFFLRLLGIISLLSATMILAEPLVKTWTLSPWVELHIGIWRWSRWQLVRDQGHCTSKHKVGSLTQKLSRGTNNEKGTKSLEGFPLLQKHFQRRFWEDESSRLSWGQWEHSSSKDSNVLQCRTPLPRCPWLFSCPTQLLGW